MGKVSGDTRKAAARAEAMPLGIKPTVDFAFKKIFGAPENRPALIGLLNAILTLPRPIGDVEILNPFSYQEFAEDKLIVLDIRARDTEGRLLNIEMQLSVVPGLIKRLVYYGCSLYVDQLQAGAEYEVLCPAISICLLREVLFRDTKVAHHRFQLTDAEHGRTLEETIEVHTIELTKYNVDERSLREASEIEKWVFFLLYADGYDAERLRQLLPEEPFQRAIATAEAIAERTEDRVMYDQREKALRDYQWVIESARREAREKGLQEGREKGREEGRQEGREEGRQEGREEGRQEGMLIGKIQILEQLLNEPATPAERFSQLSLDELKSLLAQLQERLRRRGEKLG